MSYFRHTLSNKGVQPDPKKLTAIQEMEPPKNRQELETLLGMVSDRVKFTNHCSHEKPVKEQLRVCMGLFTRQNSII